MARSVRLNFGDAHRIHTALSSVRTRIARRGPRELVLELDALLALLDEEIAATRNRMSADAARNRARRQRRPS